MSGAVAMAVVGVGYLLGTKNVAIWMLRKNDEFLAKQVPKIEQLETELKRLTELCGEEEE
jgi:hypothetical protein